MFISSEIKTRIRSIIVVNVSIPHIRSGPLIT